MNRKIISIALVLALTFSIVIPIALVGGAGVPNADHIYVTTFGGPETVDPAWAYDTASAEAIQNVYEPLCAFDGMSTANFVARLLTIGQATLRTGKHTHSYRVHHTQEHQ